MGEVESQTYLAGQLKRHIVLVIENSANIHLMIIKIQNLMYRFLEICVIIEAMTSYVRVFIYFVL